MALKQDSPSLTTELPGAIVRRHRARCGWRWHDAVEDGVSESGLADDLVSIADRQLAGDQGRDIGVAVLEDLQQVTALIGTEAVGPPVERTLAWISRNRRLAKDFECLARKSLAFIRLAMIKLMLRRLART